MEEALTLQVGQGFNVALYAQCFTHLASCDFAGAVGELLTVLLAGSWPFARSARDVSQTAGKYHTSISHDVRAVVDPSACDVDLATLAVLHPLEGTTDRELWMEAKFTSIKVKSLRSSYRVHAIITFTNDPTGTLVVVSMVVPSARCIVQLARAGKAVQAARHRDGNYQTSVKYYKDKESLGRAEVRLLRKLLGYGWFAVRLIAINGPGDACVPTSEVSQVY